MTQRDDERREAQALVAAIKTFQDSVDVFDTTAAAALEINTTDLRCLTTLRDQGALTAGEVATRLGLTRGATTTALDRLEARGYLSREANVEDGRSVVVALTSQGQDRVDATWGPMRRRGGAHLRSYSFAELHLLRSFFERSIDLQKRCTEELLAEGGAVRQRARSKNPPRR